MRTYSAMAAAVAVLVSGVAFAGTPNAAVAELSTTVTQPAKADPDSSKLVASKTRGVGVAQVKETLTTTTTVRVQVAPKASERVYWLVR